MKLSSFLGIFYRMSDYVPSFVLKLLYYSFIYPHLTYGVLLWGTALNYLMQKNFVLQKKFVRLICNASFREHTKRLYFALKLLNIYKIYQFQVCMFAHNEKYCPSTVGDMCIKFNQNVSYNLRNYGATTLLSYLY